MKKMKVSSIQFCHENGNVEKNMETVKKMTAQAAAQGSELAVFPEMCITGYWGARDASKKEIENLSEEVPNGKSTQALLELAAKHNITVCAGLIEKSSDGKLYNTYVAAMPDGRTAAHRKIHCFINKHMSSGDSFTVFELPNGNKAGMLICYDNNITENMRINALMGAEIMLSPHQTGGCDTPSPRCMGAVDVELWENRKENPEAIEAEFKGHKGRGWLMRWLPSRAHDNGLFLIFSNGVGRDDNEVRTGNSMIIDFYGDILAETWKAQDDIVTAELDPEGMDSSTGRRWIKSRRPELYKPLSVPTGQEKDIRTVRFNL